MLRLITLCFLLSGTLACDGEVHPSPPSVESIDQWLNKSKIQSILDAVENPFLIQISSGEIFEFQDTSFNAGDLTLVAYCLSKPEDWSQVPFWTMALSSDVAVTRFIAYNALLNIHRRAASDEPFRYHLDPKSKLGKEERAAFLNRLTKLMNSIIKSQKNPIPEKPLK